MELELSQYSGKCACGKEHTVATKTVLIDSGATDKLCDIIDRLKLPNGGCVISDSNTRRYADNIADKLVSRLKHIKPVVMLDSRDLHADGRGLLKAEESLPNNVSYLIAAGAGTIHDITRHIAKIRDIPFISYPTACTVDGFASSLCSATDGKLKNTAPGVAPIAVVADTDVFSAAPYRLTASGIGEMLGKYTALADWKCANLLLNEDICDRIYSMNEAAVNNVRKYLPAIHAGDRDAYEDLMRALIISGISTQMWGDSRPVSGSEHHLSHLWETGILNPVTGSLHGERVGIGLLTALRFYGKIHKLDDIGQAIQPYQGMPLPYMRKHLGALYEDILKENQPDPLRLLNTEKIVGRFPELKRIIKRLPDARKLRPFMQAAGCLTTMEEIGLSREILPDSLILAPFVRRRTTIMRIAKLLPL